MSAKRWLKGSSRVRWDVDGGGVFVCFDDGELDVRRMCLKSNVMFWRS